MAIINVSISQFLPIRQTDNSNIKGLTLNQTLVFIETISSQHKVTSVRHTFTLSQKISLTRVINLSVNQGFALYQSGAPIEQETVLQTFYAWQTIKKGPVAGVTQLLKLNQVYVGVHSIGMYNTLICNQTIIGNRYSNQVVSQTINFIQGTLGTKSEDCQSLIPFELNGPNSSGGNIF